MLSPSFGVKYREAPASADRSRGSMGGHDVPRARRVWLQGAKGYADTADEADQRGYCTGVEISNCFLLFQLRDQCAASLPARAAVPKNPGPPSGAFTPLGTIRFIRVFRVTTSSL